VICDGNFGIIKSARRLWKINSLDFDNLYPKNDNYRKFLLTTDEFEFNNEGIELLNLERWVLNG